jgi:hypothetical protein
MCRVERVELANMQNNLMIAGCLGEHMAEVEPNNCRFPPGCRSPVSLQLQHGSGLARQMPSDMQKTFFLFSGSFFCFISIPTRKEQLPEERNESE